MKYSTSQILCTLSLLILTGCSSTPSASNEASTETPSDQLYGNHHTTEENYWRTVDQEATWMLGNTPEDTLSINDQTDYQMQTSVGKTTRFYVANTTKKSIETISISPDMKKFEEEENPNVAYHSEKIKNWLKVVGKGIDRVETEYKTKNITLAPGEQYIFEAYFKSPGTYNITHQDKTVGTITVSKAAFSTNQVEALRQERIKKYPAAKINIENMSQEEIVLNYLSDLYDNFLNDLRENTKNTESSTGHSLDQFYASFPTIPNFTSLEKTLFKEVQSSGDFTMIDVRTPEEISEGKIEANALEIDFYEPTFQDELLKLDKNKKYLLYCRSGNRSGKTLRLMKEAGFKEVYDLSGGIKEWDETLQTDVTPVF